MSSKHIEREAAELFDKAKKAADLAAADEGPVEAEVQRCLDALRALRAIPLTLAILVSTQIGKRLRVLTKHPRNRIRTTASDIIEEWKKLVTSETTANNSSKASKAEDNSVKPIKIKENVVKLEKAASKTEDNSVKPIKIKENVDKLEKAEALKVEKKYKEESEINNQRKLLSASSSNGPPKLTSMIKCNDVYRDKFREILHEALSKVANEVQGDDLIRVNGCDPIRVAVAVETVMFEKLGRSNGAQKLKYRSIMFNLKDNNNPDLRRRVLLGEIKPEKLIVMTPEEMASDQRKLENQQIKEKALFECERGMPKGATTDQFKCGKCGQRKCTYYQMQTRSADEPMTTYVTCMNCNNRWKFC
eukprot:TRINITY_DN35681_c0_g1_i1.p1 TRINITY_DN35681_c0_g1~~TRINITY_DN35681_c0_g1_i1.p1  ORF type:complete len:361 (-),score=84.78 TRINITY_DN35681_c0_g1_i1:460-1542(-)